LNIIKQGPFGTFSNPSNCTLILQALRIKLDQGLIKYLCTLSGAIKDNMVAGIPKIIVKKIIDAQQQQALNIFIVYYII